MEAMPPFESDNSLVFANPVAGVEADAAAHSKAANRSIGQTRSNTSSTGHDDLFFHNLTQKSQAGELNEGFTFDPEGPFRRAWDSFILCLVIYSSTVRSRSTVRLSCRCTF